MKRVLFQCVAASALLLGGGAGAASGAVVGATVVDASSGDYTLTSVSLTRGGVAYTYEPFQLTNVQVTDVDAFDIPLVVSGGAALPPAGSRADMLEDWRLDTGVVNITSTNGTADRSLEVTFATPVVNSAGEDIVLFDLSGGDAVRFWVNDDRTGQGATVANSAFSGNLLSGMPFTSFTYRNGTDANVLSLADLEADASRFTVRPTETTGVQAVGLDLSLVGVPLGASVSSIRLQSPTGKLTPTVDLGRLDPLLIVGLPAVPEPGAMAVVGVVALGLMRRARRAR